MSTVLCRVISLHPLTGFYINNFGMLFKSGFFWHQFLYLSVVPLSLRQPQTSFISFYTSKCTAGPFWFGLPRSRNGICMGLFSSLKNTCFTCSAHSSGGEMAFFRGHNRICSDCLLFSCQDFGLAPAGPGIDASPLARDCDPGACGHHSAWAFPGTFSRWEPLGVGMEGDAWNGGCCCC